MYGDCNMTGFGRIGNWTEVHRTEVHIAGVCMDPNWVKCEGGGRSSDIRR